MYPYPLLKEFTTTVCVGPTIKAQVNTHATQKIKCAWQQPLRLPGNLLAWMDDSIKLQGAKGRKKIGKDGENLG